MLHPNVESSFVIGEKCNPAIDQTFIRSRKFDLVEKWLWK